MHRIWPYICRVGQNHIYPRCVYGIFGWEFTKYTVIYGVYIRFWPTLYFWLFPCQKHRTYTVDIYGSGQPCSFGLFPPFVFISTCVYMYSLVCLYMYSYFFWLVSPLRIQCYMFIHVFISTCVPQAWGSLFVRFKQQQHVVVNSNQSNTTNSNQSNTTNSNQSNTTNSNQSNTTNSNQSNTTNGNQSNITNSNQSRPQTVTKATRQAVTKATRQTVIKATLQTVIKATLQTVIKATLQTVTKATRQTVTKATRQTVTKATRQTVIKATRQTETKATLQTIIKATGLPFGSFVSLVLRSQRDVLGVSYS